MSTLSTITSDLRNYMKLDPNDKIWGASVKQSAVNSGYFQIQKDGNFKWPQNEATTTSATVGGTSEYSLPSDFIRLDMAQFPDTLGELYPYTKEMTLKNGTSSQGRPSNYYLWGDKIGFYPTPDTTYTYLLLYRKRLPTMTSAVDSALPDDFDNAIVRYAAYILWSTTKNERKAAQALQDYSMFMLQLKNSYLYQDANMSFGYQRQTNRRIQYDPRIIS